MTRVRVTCVVCVLGGALAFTSSGYGQQRNQSTAGQAMDQQRADAVEAEAVAESIIAREEAAAGRAFDPAFRAKAKADLASRSLGEMAVVQKRGVGLVPESPYTLGASSGADLVFTPVTPCRIINTRLAGGPILAGTTRSFFAAGSGFTSQGGVAGSCGVPFGPTTAVVVNIVAVDAAGAGDLRGFPFGAAVPTASIINYAKVSDQVNPSLVLNVANGLVLKICDPSLSACGFDLTIQADVSATQVVADVLGFFRKVDSTMTQYAFTGTAIALGDNFFMPTATYTPPQDQKCVVVETWAADLSAAYTTGTSFTQVALQTTGTNANVPFGTYLFFNPIHTGMTASAVVSLTAGTVYRFGCYVNAGGDLVNATTPWYCNVSFHCQ